MEMIEVVIVEDDPMVLELHRQYVCKMRAFRLIGDARNGKEGFQVISSLKPQLVILDIYMPEGDGIEILKKIRSLGINTDVILVTAAQNSEIIQQGMQYGVVDYIIKPFTFQRFKKALTDYCRYISKIKDNCKLTQADIDGLKKSSVTSETAQDSLPKGLDRNTLNMIVLRIRKLEGYFTVNEISEVAGISRVTVRRYVNYLHDNGWLKAILSYGPVGRPIHKYRTVGSPAG
ncbi:MAG TPA: response regulator [Negativicutes bacterium]